MNVPDSSAGSAAERSKGPVVIAVAVVVLLILHQDNWNWDDGSLVFGFIPKGLAYHACISIAATIMWFVATIIAWPLDESADGLVSSSKETLDEAATDGSRGGQA